MKKAIIILLVLAAIGGAGYVIYRVRQKKASENKVTGGGSDPTVLVKPQSTPQPADTVR